MSRTKGSRDRKMIDAQKKAEELRIDPFEILLLFAAGNWEALGYEKKTKLIPIGKDNMIEEDVIGPELRMNAARDATNYIFAKRKAIEFDIKDLPDQAFDQEIERRVHLKILRGEIKASDVG